MKLGFLTACLPQMSLDDLIQFAAASGFHTLELAAWPVESDRDYQARQIDAANFNKDEAQKVKSLFSENDLKISSMAYYDNNIHPDKEKRSYYINHLKKVIDTAEMLDVELVGTFVGSMPGKSPTG